MAREAKPTRGAVVHEGHRLRAPAWLAGALVAAGLLAIVLTLALCSYVPFQDVPNHIEVLTLDRTLRNGDTSPFLEPGPTLAFGYSLVVHLSRILAPLIGTAGVVRLVCILSAIGLPLAAVPLARVTGARAAWAALLALPLALSWPLRVGLVHYTLALPFVVLGVAAVLWVGQGADARRVLALAGCSVGCYLAHPLAFGFLVVAGAVTALVPGQGQGGAKGYVLRVLRAALGLGAALPLLALDLVGHRMSMLPDADATIFRSPVWWRPMPMAARHIITRGLGVTGRDALAYYEPFLLVLVVAAVMAWRRPAPARRWALLAPALLGSVATVLLPESREHVFLMGSRVAVLGIVFWTAVATPALGDARWLRAAAVPAVALTLGFQIHEIVGRAAIVHDVLGPVGPRAVSGTYLPVQVPRCRSAATQEWGDYDPLRHAWAYALAHDGVAPYIFAASRYQPIWFRTGVLADDLRAPNEHLLDANEEPLSDAACEAEAQNRLDAANAWGGTYDGVLVTGRQPELGEAIERSGLAIERELAPGMILVEPGAARSGLRVEFGRLAGKVALRSGFYGDEIIDGKSAQWSQGTESVLGFTEDDISRDYLLHLVASSPVVSSIVVTINDRYRTTIPVQKATSETVAHVPGSALDLGKNEIRLGYSATFVPREPWAPGPPRELSVLYREMSLSALPPSNAVDVGAAGARSRLESGFSHDEIIDGRTAAWSDGSESVVTLDLAAGAPRYLLTVGARAIVPQAVSVTFNGGWTGTVQAGDGWGEWNLVVPSDAVLPGRNSIRFTYASPVRPVDRGQGDDARLLGMAFDTIALGPVPVRADVECAAPGARSALRSGFSRAETIDGRSAVWSDGKSSEIVLTVSGEDVAHRLTIDATARSLQHATITWNGSYESPIDVPPSWNALTVIVPPGVVRPGPNSLKITYATPGHPDGDPRLLAVAYREVTLEPVRPDDHVEFGTPAGRRVLRAGWSGDEVIDGRPAAWSLGTSSEIELTLAPPPPPPPPAGTTEDAGLLDAGAGAAEGDAGAPARGAEAPEATLEFTVTPFAPIAPVPMQVVVNEQLLAKVDVMPGWASYRVPIPRGVLRSGTNTVRWIYGKSARPSDVLPSGSDSRVLAVAFHELWLR